MMQERLVPSKTIYLFIATFRRAQNQIFVITYKRKVFRRDCVSCTLLMFCLLAKRYIRNASISHC